MTRRHHRSTGNLLLMELILILLFLSLAASICVRLFFLSWQNQKKAEEYQHIQALVTEFGELLEANPGGFEKAAFESTSDTTEDGYVLYYDRSWNPCTRQEGFYSLSFKNASTDTVRRWKLVFSSDSHLLVEQWIAFPGTDKKEDPS